MSKREKVDEGMITELRRRDEVRKAQEAEDRRRYGAPGVRVGRRLSDVELRAIEMVRERNAGGSGGETRNE